MTEDEVRPIADKLWRELSGVTRTGIDKLKNREGFEPNDLIMLSRLNSPYNDKTDIGSAIDERYAITGNASRVLNALNLVDEIRSEGVRAYSEMLMPHARESQRVQLDQLYVTRHLHALPPDWQLRDTGPSVAVPVELDEDEIRDRRYVVIGTPGVGKTTFVRRLLYSICRDQEDRLAPLIFELKSWSDNSGSLASMLAVRLRSTLQIETSERNIVDCLNLGLLAVILDGLDEIVDISERRTLVRAVESFSRRYPLATVVVSSRREGYDSAPLDPVTFSTYQVPDFTDRQMAEYSGKWFNLVSSFEDVDPDLMHTQFLAESVHVIELRRNPLMLSLLCLLYQYDGYIPENRIRIYEECAELLFWRWDRIRNVKNVVKSDARGHHLIEEIAYYFYKRQSSQAGETRQKLHIIIKNYVWLHVVEDEFRAETYAQDFLDHCAGRGWLLAPVGGSVRGERLFAFSHRTFMEYFAACYISRHADNATALVAELAPIIEAGASDVICHLAMDRFGERTLNGLDDTIHYLLFGSLNLEHKVNYRFLRFIVRSLEFLQPSPRVIQSIIRAELREVAKSGVENYERCAIVSMPTRYSDSVQNICEGALATTDLNARALELADGARIYEYHSRVDDLEWSIKNTKKLVVARVIAGKVPLAKFRKFARAGCLIDLTNPSSTEGVVLGPLAKALSIATEAGYITEALARIFSLGVRDPGALMPVGVGVIIEMTDLLQNISEWLQESIFGARRPTQEQPIAGFTHVCAALAAEAARHKMKYHVEVNMKVGFDADLDGDEFFDIDNL